MLRSGPAEVQRPGSREVSEPSARQRRVSVAAVPSRALKRLGGVSWCSWMLAFVRLWRDRDQVVEGAGLAGHGCEADANGRVTEGIVLRDVPEVRPEPDLVAGGTVRPPVQAHIGLAGDTEVRVRDVVHREHGPGQKVESPRAQNELLTALEDIRLRTADRSRCGAGRSSSVDAVDVDTEVELRSCRPRRRWTAPGRSLRCG